MNPWFPIMLIALFAAAVKVMVWSIYGPVYFNDTHLYEAFANYLLQDDWQWQYTVFDDPTPVTGLRMIGYPTVIAFAQLVAGDNWQHLLVGFQIFVSLIALVTVLHWANAILQSIGKTAVVGLAVATGQAVLYDVALLPDSLFSSLAAIVLCFLCPVGGDRQRETSWVWPLACGVAVSLMVLLRANGFHVALLFAPLALCWIASRPRNTAVHALLLILPIVVTVQTYTFWNQHRTGERFLSTGGQIAAFQPLYNIARMGVDPFSGDDPLSRAVRATTTTYAYGDIYALNTYLAKENGWTAVDIDKAGRSAFVRTVFNEPMAILKNAGKNFGFDVIRALANPAFTITETHHLITQERLFRGFSKLIKSFANLGLLEVIYTVAYALGALFSGLVFAAFAFLVPINVWTRPIPVADRAFQFTLWAGCVGVLAFYSVIHLELRYVMPLTPFILTLGLWAVPNRQKRWGLR